MATNKIKKFMNDLNMFESEFVIIKKRKDDGDKIMKIPGHWNMVPRQAAEFYIDSLNRCISFIENVVETFSNGIEEEEEEIKEPIKEEPKKEEIKEKTPKKNWEDLDDKEKTDIIKELSNFINKPNKDNEASFRGMKVKICSLRNLNSIPFRLLSDFLNFIKKNDLQQISENNSISGSIDDMGV